MKINNMKLNNFGLAIILTICSFGAYVEESHITEALKHAQAAVTHLKAVQ
ncbi:small metal-binding protein SmbP [Methylobacter sp. S3L5C]|nr:small metal-binding protein SmbP [Methylobacter sp. S3L5C]UOA08565.1 hypothetical protein KKZ03_20630 [Methylobacter sp. S3L5C]